MNSRIKEHYKRADKKEELENLRDIDSNLTTFKRIVVFKE